ncbi:MAG: hypothetical protein N3A54_06460 [Patescibacteria group bacterium]|nr:hypothetical protein [Patescibacteria group bacterium]
MNQPLKYINYYCKISVYILIFSGIAKLLFSMQEDKFLTNIHPLFHIFTNRQVFGLVGFLELILATLISIESSELLKTSIIFWLSAMFVSYRTILRFIGYKGPCNCLGNIKELINLSDYLSLAFLIFMFVGGCISLYWILKSKMNIRRQSVGY